MSSKGFEPYITLADDMSPLYLFTLLLLHTRNHLKYGSSATCTNNTIVSRKFALTFDNLTFIEMFLMQICWRRPRYVVLTGSCLGMLILFVIALFWIKTDKFLLLLLLKLTLVDVCVLINGHFIKKIYI